MASEGRMPAGEEKEERGDEKLRNCCGDSVLCDLCLAELLVLAGSGSPCDAHWAPDQSLLGVLVKNDTHKLNMKSGAYSHLSKPIPSPFVWSL